MGLKSDNAPMTEPNPTAPSAEDKKRQLEHILHSAIFRSSPLLQRFLEYITLKNLGGLDHEIKEYAIGTEVFGRPSDFDPKIDPLVRVEAFRLREKLKEYYQGEGMGDELLIEIPKGHYVPRFVRGVPAVPEQSPRLDAASPLTAGDLGSAAKESQDLSPHNRPSTRAFGWTWIAIGLGVVLVFLAGMYTSWRWRAAQEHAETAVSLTSVTSRAGEKPLLRMWKGFLGSEGASVFFENHVFLVTTTGDMVEYFGSALAGQGAAARAQPNFAKIVQQKIPGYSGPVFYDDGYTGTGEAQAVSALTHLFTRMGVSCTANPSRLLTADDLASHNVIFLGAGADRMVADQVPVTGNFVFQNLKSAGGIWTDGIRNLHPSAGEQTWYEAKLDPTTQVMVGDWALISFLPGIAPHRRIAVLAGLSTEGTLAAAQFATSPQGAEVLLHQIGMHTAGSIGVMPPFFQALLRVRIVKGVVVNVRYVAGRVIRSAS